MMLSYCFFISLSLIMVAITPTPPSAANKVGGEYSGLQQSPHPGPGT